MKRLLILSLVVAGGFLPALAQRGGGARGGFSGGARSGFSGGGAGFRSSGPVSSGRSFANGGPGYAPRVVSRGYAANSRMARSMPATRPGYAPRSTYPVRPGYNSMRRAPYPGRQLRYARSYGYPGAAWYIPNDLAYPFTDDESYDEAVYGAPQDNYVASAPEPEPGNAEEPYPQSHPAIAQPAPAREDLVTLVFKDGRPNEQIRNYMITATTLTVVQGHRMHDVAIADLDLAATEKVNRAAGVSFKLPTSN